MQLTSVCIDTKDEIIKDTLTKCTGDVKLAGVPILQINGYNFNFKIVRKKIKCKR